MLDIKMLRTNLETIENQLISRGYQLDVEQFKELEKKRKVLQVETQELQNEKKIKSKEVGRAKAKDEDIEPLLVEVSRMGDRLKQNEQDLSELQKRIEVFLSAIPNIPDISVPIGKDENDNQEISRWGKIPNFDFEPLDHVDLGSNLMDFKVASKLTGTRFVALKSQLAKLHRALIQLMLDTHTNEYNYNEVYVPYIVNKDSLYGTGQLPKFEADLFKLKSDQDFYLIPTAEVPITNLVRDTILNEDELPLKFVAHTPCFRSEAGAYGRDTRGLIRQHQFEKVELVQIVKPEDAKQAFEELTQQAESILRKLELPYRRMNLCTGDIGFSANKTYDLEVWLPAQNTYREISSCSCFGDFQARRMQARYRIKGQKKLALVNTINGSGLAVGRTLAAIMENYQQQDGSIKIPSALQSYMAGLSEIKA